MGSFEEYQGGILTAGEIFIVVSGFFAVLFVVYAMASEGVSPGDIFEWMTEPFRWFFEQFGIETRWA